MPSVAPPDGHGFVGPRQKEAPDAVAGQGESRTEHDLLGVLEVPAQAYYGVHTVRAVENFPVTGLTIGRYPTLVRGLVAVKQAAAMANRDLGGLEPEVAEAIIAACSEIRDGRLHDQFVVDVIQGGAGTSTNMNVNEVVANRALELLGHPKGRYDVVHPIEHVNRSQSTNDAYPTAVRVALHESLEGLLSAVQVLEDAFLAKSGEFVDVLKIGRTQLQEAVPMTLGLEFGTFATMVRQAQRNLRACSAQLCEVNLGGTAIGTGLTAPQGYSERAVGALAQVTGIDIRQSADTIEATQGTGAFVILSGALKALAVKLSKISNDLRLLSSGPRAGFAEITLPAVQAGSSIMPGKINPVIPEMVNQVAFAVIGRDVTVSMASEAGQLQLNAFEPVMVVSLLDSIDQLGTACRVLAQRCVAGIGANSVRLRHSVEHSIGLVTALLPYIGYERATLAAAEALALDTSVLGLLEEHGLVPEGWEQTMLGPTPRPVVEPATGTIS